MRVIEIGKIGEETTQCPNCYAELAYFPADKRRKRVTNYYFTLLDCPICGKPIVLEKTENPWSDIID